MKNLKVSVKLGLIIVSVVIMVIVASLMSVNDMNQDVYKRQMLDLRMSMHRWQSMP